MSSISEEEVAIDNYKENATVYKDISSIKENIPKFFKNMNLPKGLIPLDDDLLEFGHNDAAGFFWVTRKDKKEHVFKSIRSTVVYEAEVTAFVEDRRMKKLTGVKGKEWMFTIPIANIFVDEKDPTMITFSTSGGLSRTHPVSAFEEDDDNGNGKENEKTTTTDALTTASATSKGNNEQLKKNLSN